MGLIGGLAKKAVKKAATKAAVTVAANIYSNYDDSKHGEKAQLDKCTFEYVAFIRDDEVYDDKDNRIYKLKKPAFSHNLILIDRSGSEIGKINGYKVPFLDAIDMSLSVDGNDYGTITKETLAHSNYSIGRLGWKVEQFKFMSHSFAVYDRAGDVIIRFHQTSQDSIVVEYNDKNNEHIALLLAKVDDVYISLC